MSDSQRSTSSSTPSVNPATSGVTQPTPASTVPLGEAIRRGWDWVVFVWQVGGRMGGPIVILKSIGTGISILVSRTLVQWGLAKKK